MALLRSVLGPPVRVVSPDQDETLSLLWNAVLGGIQNSPLGVVPQIPKALVYPVERGPFFVSEESDHVLHYETLGPEVVHVKCELFKQIVARIVICGRPEWP